MVTDISLIGFPEVPALSTHFFVNIFIISGEEKKEKQTSKQMYKKDCRGLPLQRDLHLWVQISE